MKYIDEKTAEKYLIYCYSDFKKEWKIEKIPFDGSVSVVSEKAKDEFIRNRNLKPIMEN